MTKLVWIHFVSFLIAHQSCSSSPSWALRVTPVIAFARIAPVVIPSQATTITMTEQNRSPLMALRGGVNGGKTDSKRDDNANEKETKTPKEIQAAAIDSISACSRMAFVAGFVGVLLVCLEKFQLAKAPKAQIKGAMYVFDLIFGVGMMRTHKIFREARDDGDERMKPNKLEKLSTTLGFLWLSCSVLFSLDAIEIADHLNLLVGHLTLISYTN